ncbi:MAG: hypothetical protein A4E39_02003 [Methanoregulaceae archaeon PtaB.Bin152]|nr:MAG: hypothetical protein A4E39_02003 [Methanoregulaceae archaeon PtaB.Bin152]
MPEEMGSDALCDTRSLGNSFNLGGQPAVGDWFVSFREKHWCIRRNRSGIIGPPFRDIFLGHDEPDIPGYSCLEVQVHRNTLGINLEISPTELPNLPDTEPSLVECEYECPVS